MTLIMTELQDLSSYKYFLYQQSTKLTLMSSSVYFSDVWLSINIPESIIHFFKLSLGYLAVNSVNLV